MGELWRGWSRSRRADEETGIDRRTVFGDVPVSHMNPDWTPETMPDHFQPNLYLDRGQSGFRR